MVSSTFARHRLPLAASLAEVREQATSEEKGEGDTTETCLQVGDLAKAVGKTVRAIHLYEELGLLRPHGRSKGKFRLFEQGAIARARWIGTLQELGLSLREIQTIVRALEDAPSASGAMQQLRTIYQHKLTEAQVQIRRWEALAAELTASLVYLDTCDRCDPARLLGACTACDLHPRQQPAPELVAGFHAGYPTFSLVACTSPAAVPLPGSAADP